MDNDSSMSANDLLKTTYETLKNTLEGLTSRIDKVESILHAIVSFMNNTFRNYSNENNLSKITRYQPIKRPLEGDKIESSGKKIKEETNKPIEHRKEFHTPVAKKTQGNILKSNEEKNEFNKLNTEPDVGIKMSTGFMTGKNKNVAISESKLKQAMGIFSDEAEDEPAKESKEEKAPAEKLTSSQEEMLLQVIEEDNITSPAKEDKNVNIVQNTLNSNEEKHPKS